MCALKCLPAGDKRKATAGQYPSHAHMCELRGDFKRRRKTANPRGNEDHSAHTTAVPSRMLEFHAMLMAAKDQRGSSRQVQKHPHSSVNNGAHGFAAASTSTGCALANKRTKVGRNAIEKQLLARLDACIPAEFRSAAQRKCAGKRSVGASGRSTIDILRDSVRSVAAALRSGCASSSESSFSQLASSGTTTDSDACMPSIYVDELWPIH